MSPRAQEALELKNGGFQNWEIALKMGISIGWTYVLLNYKKYNDTTLRRRALIRRRNGAGQYECGVCGKLGHNARRHK